MNYADYPLKDIPEPHAHDVLCGRGGGTNNHIGNSHWRMLVAANKQLYITLPKRQKMLLSRSIVNAVRSQNPPGRFLQKDGKTKLWFDVGDQRAQEKTSQALREGAPDIRKKVAAAKATVSAGSDSTSPTLTPKAPTSGEVSNLGAKTDGVETPQIPGHSSGDRKPETAGSSSILPQASGTGGGMLPEPQHFNMQQQQRQQQQMNAMYGGHNATGHMTLNERGVMIQNAMMNVRNLNGQNHAPMMNNDSNFNHPAFMYQQQQQQQQGHMQHQMHQQQDYQQQYQYQQQQQQQQHNNTVNYQQEQRQNHYQQQQQQYHGNSNGGMSNYDNYVAPPPEELERDGLSFGSIHMTDAEMHKLQQGSSHGMSKNSRHSISKQRNNNSSNNNGNNMPSVPMGGVLEPTGISFGDVSMHSAATNFTMKLEENGTSFGTMMSYNTLNGTNHSMNPDMVDGGLMDAVGTSFGSLSLDKNNRDMLFKTLEIAGGGSQVPPMFQSETKSSANLLDCSDTESESSQDKEKLTKQKSQAWEMMKTQLDKQTSKGTINSQDLMPPPAGVPQTNGNNNSNKHTFDNIEIALPPTTMEANFSTLSAWSAAEDEYNESPPAAKGENTNGTGGNDDNSQEDAAAIPPPPPELVKVDSF